MLKHKSSATAAGHSNHHRKSQTALDKTRPEHSGHYRRQRSHFQPAQPVTKLTDERLERLRQRVDKFQSYLHEIKASIKKASRLG